MYHTRGSTYSQARRYRITDTNAYHVLDGFDPVTKAGRGPWFPENFPVSDEAKDLIGRMLKKDVADRATVLEVLSHPWLVGKGGDKQPSKAFRDARRFSSIQTKLKGVILSALTLDISQMEMQGIEQVFQQLDYDKDGLISAADLTCALRREKASETIISRVLKVNLLLFSGVFICHTRNRKINHACTSLQIWDLVTV